MAEQSRFALAAAALALVLATHSGAGAQDPSGAQSEGQSAPRAGAEHSQRAPAGKGESQGGALEGSAQGLTQRVEQLEEQLVDLQVVIGTLESLARSGGARSSQLGPEAPAPGSVGLASGDLARLEGMETQIRALTAQIEQLSSEVRAQGALPRRSDLDAGPNPPAAGVGRFGSTTVTSGSTDPIGRVMAESTPGGAVGAPPMEETQTLPPIPGPVAAADPVPDPGAANPKQLYEVAYGYLLQQDYSAAQTGFGDFLKRYPKDPLAPNALYWLGETHYVQKNFADAAEAFDLVVTSFTSSAKAPDAQLKRGMALAQLGKKQDACTALRDIAAKYPSAPAHVKSKAESERQRVGCP